MARNKPNKKTNRKIETTHQDVKGGTFVERISKEAQNQFSYLNLVLGALIVFVLGVLLFNYFNRPKGELGPSTDTTTKTQQTEQLDVTKDSLPGKYTVKEGDTLFNIAKAYYDDGYLFPKISEANKLEDPNNITTNQVLEIPKLELAQANPEPTPQASPVQQTAQTLISADVQTQPLQGGTGGAINQTEWGEKITGTTYTVTSGDWLSKIAGRAYGDIYSYTKIAAANNISNPDLIEPGTVLTIPR